MSESSSLGTWVRRFLLEYLVGERNLAHNTQRSYRDTLVLLFPFVAAKLNKPVDQLAPIDLSAEVVRLFLTHLEKVRQCSIATRNQRLAGLHALARFVGERSPEHIVWCGQIRAIPFKKTTKAVIPYLDKPEMDALLAAPDRQTRQGQHDYALLLFLYNSGARADEASQLIIRDLHSADLFVRIVGKGRKERQCPLWRTTAETLAFLIGNRSPGDRVFLNRCGDAMTRFGIHAMVERHAKKACEKMPSLANKRVSPHTIRHTTACHLLRAGVDINTIRAWLGHVSLDTTNIYAEIDLEMKARALAMCEVDAGPEINKSWREDPQLMNFLRSL
jgi:site-specific recombinase XerD